jgi:hypothetical protein
MRHAGQRDGSTDDRVIRAEMTPPQMFGEHDDVRTAGLFVRLNQSPSRDRTQPEESRDVEARLDAQQLLRLAGAAENFTARAVRADGLEYVAPAIAPVNELGK